MADDKITPEVNSSIFNWKGTPASEGAPKEPIKVSVDNWGASGLKDFAKLLSPDNKNPLGTVGKAAGTAVGKITGLDSEKTGAVGEALLGGAAAYGDAITGVRKAITEIDSASQTLGKTLGDKDYFASVSTGIEQASKATNLGVGEIVQKMGELYKTSTFMAAGLKDTDTAAERSRKEFEGLAQSVNVARAVGLNFNDMASAQNTMFQNQAMSTEQSAEAMILLKDATAGTSLSMPRATKMVEGLSGTYKYLSFNVGTATKALESVMKSQKEMELAGISHVFKNDIQAAETYGEALTGVKGIQEDFGQALSTAAMTGGGVSEAFDMMTGKISQEEIMNKAMKEVARGTTGRDQLMTREEAEAGGEGGKTLYIQEAQKLASKLHIGTTQAMGMMDMSKDIIRGNKEAIAAGKNLLTGKDATGKAIAAQATPTEGAAALNKTLSAQKDQWPQLLTTQEQMASLSTTGNLIMGTMGRDVSGKLIPTTMSIANSLMKMGLGEKAAKELESKFSVRGYEEAKSKSKEAASEFLKPLATALNIPTEQIKEYADNQLGMKTNQAELDKKYPSAAPTKAGSTQPATPATPTTLAVPAEPTTSAAPTAKPSTTATPPTATPAVAAAKVPTTAAVGLAPATTSKAASEATPTDQSKVTLGSNLDPTKNEVLDGSGTSSVARRRNALHLGAITTGATASMGNLGAMLDQKKSAATLATKPANITVDNTMKKDAATQATTLSASKPAPAPATATAPTLNNAQTQSSPSQTQYVGKAEINIIVEGKKIASAIVDHLPFQRIAANEAQQKGKA